MQVKRFNLPGNPLGGGMSQSIHNDGNWQRVDTGEWVSRAEHERVLMHRLLAIEQERKDCERALAALSGAGICTPEETYGTNSSWAIADLCRGIDTQAKRIAELEAQLAGMNAPTPEDLRQRTVGHGYEAGCECDLVGGDPDCKIQPPYETNEAYWDRLIEHIASLKEQNARLVEALEIAEIALMNSVPVVPYAGDGPLVKIRALRRAALAQKEQG